MADELASLQPLVDAAKAGDVITPEPGVYAGHLVIDKPITLDGQGRVTDDRFFSAAKKPLHSTKYVYGTLGIVAESRFTGMDTLRQRFAYEYDENGNVASIVQYDGNGKAKSIVERDYVPRTILVRR